MISCDFYLFGLFRVNSDGSRPQWFNYPNYLSDKSWKKFFKTWLRPWCRWFITCKLIKR